MREITVPIFIQISENIKDDIMSGKYATNALIMSTTQLAKQYSVNRVTASKSVSLLRDEGIVYKKRGIGMCVRHGAQEIIVAQRTKQFYENTVAEMISEAKKLHLGKSALIGLISKVEDYA